MSGRRRGLGRGLGSLLPTSTEASLDARLVAIDAIRPNPFQPRTEMDEAALAELTESIRTHGVLEPVIVRPADNGYELVVGERRWRAAQRAGLREIPAVVRAMTDQEAAVVALVENLQRQDLNPIEEAKAFKRLMELNMTQEEVAQKVGKSRPAVANSLRLLTLPPDVQALISSGQLSVGHAKVLLGVDEPQLRSIVLQQVLEKQLTVRQAEELVRTLRERKESAARARREEKRGAVKDPVWVDVEERLTEALGTRVTVQPQGKGGRIVIEFYGYEDIGRLLELIVPRGT